MTEVANALRSPSLSVSGPFSLPFDHSSVISSATNDLSDYLPSVAEQDVSSTVMPAPALAPAAAAAANGALHGQVLVSRALRHRLKDFDSDSCPTGGEDPFFVADIGEVYRQHVRWKLLLPRVEPFYAVKCNPDANVLRLLASLGTGFDCASKKEMDMVLSMGVNPNRIVYAHPCKAASFVRYAATRDVRRMTFDNAEELHKIKRYFPNAELLLRIVTDDSESLCQFSMKYGAALSSVPGLLQLGKDLDLNIVGVSFHVGSGASGSKPFVEAVRNARSVFDVAQSLGTPMNLLDIGGGFCHDTFDEIACNLGPAIDSHFPSSVRVIAEPGRYYVASAFTLAAHVIARRDVPQINSTMIYLNDGVYGNMNCILYDHQHPVVRVLTYGSRYMYGLSDNCRGPVSTSVWGPTCDGIDCISKECSLPFALNVGDWVYFEEFGAYTNAAATGFNGFNEKCDIIYVCSETGAKLLLDDCF
ncbi:pyridoxal-dependent decarboxylase [Lipomyces oligophaga]|uniref:pyridoxal-dependent decarboxylase n=1 Tax=Lipomyces oligophaga TaxID=45792 RepID=UPI0034CDF662